MTQIVYRANLTASELPLLTEFQGRSIIIPGPDQNFSRQTTSARNKDKDVGIPQAYYGHNIIGTDAGFASVGYLQVGSSPLVPDPTFQNSYYIRDTSENSGYLAVCSSGNCYALLAPNSSWLQTTSITAGEGGISIAEVNGQTYVYFGSVGCYKYNFTTNTLDSVTLTALTPTDVLGIVAASGYMIAYAKTSIAWSSTIDPTDFTPSLITGAGGGGVQQAAGYIVCCLPHNAGFMIYTKKNAVIGYYSGNAQYPFNYRQVDNAGGLSSADLVSSNANTTDHWAYTTSGLQTVGAKTATLMFAQVTDFLAGSRFEDFDETTQIFTETKLSSTMLKKLTICANRYLILSYGINELTHALIYDIGLDRWGKFKITHTQCFDYTFPSPEVVETPKRSIGFLQQDGTVKLVVMSYDATTSYGVLVLGRYQYERNKYLKLLNVDIDTILPTANVSVTAIVETQGDDPVNYSLNLLRSNNQHRRYGANLTGLNYSILFIGAFHATSMEITMIEAGDIR